MYLKGNASFQYHLGCFPKHLLKKKNLIQARSMEQLRGLPGPGDSMCRTRARQSDHLVIWPGAQRACQGAHCPGRLKLLLLLFSHSWAKGRGGRGYSIMKGYSLLKRGRRPRRGCRKRGGVKAQE